MKNSVKSQVNKGKSGTGDLMQEDNLSVLNGLGKGSDSLNPEGSSRTFEQRNDHSFFRSLKRRERGKGIDEGTFEGSFYMVPPTN